MITVSAVCAWLSGALFYAAVTGRSRSQPRDSGRNDGFGRGGGDFDRAEFGHGGDWGGGDETGPGWLAAPRILIQLGLLALLVLGGVALIVMSL